MMTTTQCAATSWQRGKPRSVRTAHPADAYETQYGPGGFNRCIKRSGHGGNHEDQFGVVFDLEPWRRIA